MAHRSLLLLAMLLVATTSVANSFIINGTQIAVVTIVGQLVCAAPPPAPPPPPNAQPVAGANVVLRCDDSAAVVSQALTDARGFYQFTLNTLETFIFDPSKCRVVARLPFARCAFTPSTGFLVSTLRVVYVLPVAGSVIGALLGNAFIVALPPSYVGP